MFCLGAMPWGHALVNARARSTDRMPVALWGNRPLLSELAGTAKRTTRELIALTLRRQEKRGFLQVSKKKKCRSTVYKVMGRTSSRCILGNTQATEMRKRNDMAMDKLCYQMGTSIRVNIAVDKDMDSGNTHLPVKKPGNERTERSK